METFQQTRKPQLLQHQLQQHHPHRPQLRHRHQPLLQLQDPQRPQHQQPHQPQPLQQHPNQPQHLHRHPRQPQLKHQEQLHNQLQSSHHHLPRQHQTNLQLHRHLNQHRQTQPIRQSNDTRHITGGGEIWLAGPDTILGSTISSTSNPFFFCNLLDLHSAIKRNFCSNIEKRRSYACYFYIHFDLLK